MPIADSWLRKTGLAAIYVLGVLSILATTDSDDNGFAADECGLSIRGIAPLSDGSGYWVGVLSETSAGKVDSVVLLDNSGNQQARFEVGSGGSENGVRAVAISTDGRGDIYVGGDFDGGILRLDSSGVLDAAFDAGTGTGFNGRVTSIAPLTTGEVYVGGNFDRYGVNIVSGLVRLNRDGSWDNLEFVTTGVTNVASVAPAEDPPLGPVYSGGTGTKSPERWSSSGTADNVFEPTPRQVLSVVPAADGSGSIYVGGPFAGGVDRLLAANGLSDPGFDVGTGFDAAVATIGRGVANDIYVGGSFSAFRGVAANGILRLNSDGSRDSNFAIGDGFRNAADTATGVATVVETTDGSADILVGGSFVEYAGTSVNGIVRLNTVGSVVPTFAVDISVDGKSCTDATIPD